MKSFKEFLLNEEIDPTEKYTALRRSTDRADATVDKMHREKRISSSGYISAHNNHVRAIKHLRTTHDISDPKVKANLEHHFSQISKLNNEIGGTNRKHMDKL